MQLFKTNHNGNEYEFVCAYKNTRNGFKHECKLFINGCWETEATCNYLNRTWERYTYQSVMYSAISNLIEERTNWLKDNFKSENGYEKMTKKRNEEFQIILDADEKIAELQKVKEQINNGF